MRRRSRRPEPAPIALAIGAALAVWLGAAATTRAAGGTCADCCKLPCIEARIWEARYMKGFYKRLAATRGLTQAQYEAREQDAKQLSGAMSGIYLGANPSCAWDTPDPRDPTSWRNRFKDTGFTLEGQGGVENWDFTLVVDPQACRLTHPHGAEVLPSVTPCDGIGRATVAHEQKHVEDCCQQRGGKLVAGQVQGLRDCQFSGAPRGGALTPAQNAQREVAGYEAELAELEKVRREAAEPCTKVSCKTAQLRFDIAARNFGTDIRNILGLDKKPPSKSPLARSRRGS